MVSEVHGHVTKERSLAEASSSKTAVRADLSASKARGAKVEPDPILVKT